MPSIYSFSVKEKKNIFVLRMFQDVGLPALCLLSSGLKHEIKSCIQQHANLISESVCNDSVSACHNVGHAATRSAVLSVCVCVCVCVCVFLCSHYINESPKHLPDHRSSCRRDLGIHNTCRSKIQNSGSSEEDRDRSWSLLCVLVVTFFEVFFFFRALNVLITYTDARS